MSEREVGGSFDEPRGGTTPLAPIPERAFAPVFAYRGMDTHGVPVEAQPWIPRDADAQSWEGQEQVYDPDVVPIQPIPVIIVEESQREIRAWRATRMYADATPRLIVGRDSRRMRVRIRNLNTSPGDSVFIGDSSNVTNISGYPIPAATDLVIDTEEEVYAYAPTGSDIAVLIEHRVV